MYESGHLTLREWSDSFTFQVPLLCRDCDVLCGGCAVVAVLWWLCCVFPGVMWCRVPSRSLRLLVSPQVDANKFRDAKKFTRNPWVIVLAVYFGQCPALFCCSRCVCSRCVCVHIFRFAYALALALKLHAFDAIHAAHAAEHVIAPGEAPELLSLGTAVLPLADIKQV